MSRFRRIAGIALLLAVVAALTVLPVQAQTPKTHTVKVGDNYYKPKKLKVVVGERVTWKWTGSARHDVTVKKGPQKFKSKLKSDGKFSRVINKPGRYTIHCTIHPGMEMKLTAATPPPTTTTAPPVSGT